MHEADRAISIIKGKHRKVLDGEVKADPSLKTDKEIKREILNTITSWVEQLREAKKELHRQSSLFRREI